MRRLPRIHRAPMCNALALGIPFDWPVAAAADPPLDLTPYAPKLWYTARDQDANPSLGGGVAPKFSSWLNRGSVGGGGDLGQGNSSLQMSVVANAALGTDAVDVAAGKYMDLAASQGGTGRPFTFLAVVDLPSMTSGSAYLLCTTNLVEGIRLNAGGTLDALGAGPSSVTLSNVPSIIFVQNAVTATTVIQNGATVHSANENPRIRMDRLNRRGATIGDADSCPVAEMAWWDEVISLDEIGPALAAEYGLTWSA